MAAQHTAEERYNAFENLRSRFGGEEAAATGAAGAGDQERTAQQMKGKRRASRGDPRSNAPPLVPLVEEENPVDGVYNNRPLVKGKWKYNTTIKSNHLNGPDFDAIETASVASCSSAYSSKSESSVLSPPCGSTTELSDVGSCDTFQEYDILSQRKKKLPLHHLQSGGSSVPTDDPVRFTIPSPDADVADNLVQDHVRVWNGVIGDWKFEGMPPFPSPQSPPAYKVTNEVRLPTPVWTPQGSTDNLLYDSESKSSLFSSEDDYSWFHERLGLHQGKSRRSNSTSSLASACQSMSTGKGVGSQEKSGAEELVQGGGGGGGEGEKQEEGDHKEAGSCETAESREKQRRVDDKTEDTDNSKGDTDVHQKTTETVPEKPSHSSNSAGTAMTSQEGGTTSSHRAPAKLMKVTDRIRLLRSQSATNLQAPRPPPVVHTPSGKSSKWLEAYHKSKTLKTVQESAGQEQERKKGERSKTTDMKVTQRAQLFGETKKCLRRRQSYTLGDNLRVQDK